MLNVSLQPMLCIPFVAVLLSLAIFPTLWPRFWHKFHFYLLLILSIPALLIAFAMNPHWVFEGFVEYANFIFLLAALYKIGGGLYVSGAPKANPIVNLGYMLFGAVLSNIIGTLGASMLLIRPLIRSNRGRKHETHLIAFFIFIVANCGGLLTPLGDPPLLMGFLQGVPFDWPLKLFPLWLFTITSLLGIFVALDSYFFLNDPDFRGPMKQEVKEPFKITGRWNLFLALLTGVALTLPQLLPHHLEYWKTALRILFLLGIIQLSEKLTPKQIKTLNNFSWAPFKEVAYIFAGIFSTMIITLKYLEQAAPTLSYNFSPWNVYLITGVLSGVLDNAPSYAGMLSLATGFASGFPSVSLLNGKEVNETILMAISAGSVFFGGLTYLGNGPNLLVKSLAEGENAQPPSFIGYIFWAMIFLFPVLALTGLLFFV